MSLAAHNEVNVDTKKGWRLNLEWNKERILIMMLNEHHVGLNQYVMKGMCTRISCPLSTFVALYNKQLKTDGNYIKSNFTKLR